MKLLTLSLLAACLFTSTSAHRRSFGPALPHQRFVHKVQDTPLPYDSFFLTAPTARPASDVVSGFLAKEFALSQDDFFTKNMYKSHHNKVTHVYLRQIVNGLEVVNADMNLNIDKDGRIISYGSSFYKGKIPDKPGTALFQLHRGENPEATGFSGKTGAQMRFYRDSEAEFVTPQKALALLFDYLEIPVPTAETMELVVLDSAAATDAPIVKVTNIPRVKSDIPVKTVYIQVNNGEELKLVWDFEVELEDNWYHAHIGVEDGQVHGLVDWVADATYNVYPLGTNDPNDGPRKVLVDPHNKNGSPLGWHDQGKDKKYTTTVGNNVYAQDNVDGAEDWKQNYRPNGGDNLVFDFKLNLDKKPKKYIDAAITNLFYVNNAIHDLFYQYGFNEESGNFQENNFGKGGIGGDAVIANAQDGSGYNNANFATPPDGRHGKMRMYVWNVIKPMRDGDLESGIVIHEYCHGISTRLTGGPANSGCLGWGEAGGMGEGWGDFFATILRMKADYNRTIDFDMGSYANGGQGIRKYKYSTSLETNPETYAVMDNPGYWGVHAKGEVWAGILYEVYWNLVDKLGFTSDWQSASKEHGNTLMFQLVVDGMKLQPCRPTFIDARDVILQAEKVLIKGAHQCEIWKGFAKRGLGVGAHTGGIFMGKPRTESFKVPKECSF